MKFILAVLALSSVTAFAQERGNCNGSEYWNIMDKSLRVCHFELQKFENEHGVSCKVDYHNTPTVCFNSCTKADGSLFAKVRVDMTASCMYQTVQYRKTKITYYR